MSKRHTDISLPLDLSDNEMVGEHAVLEAAIQALDVEGWNTKGRCLRASWIVCLLPYIDPSLSLLTQF